MGTLLEPGRLITPRELGYTRSSTSSTTRGKTRFEKNLTAKPETFLGGNLQAVGLVEQDGHVEVDLLGDLTYVTKTSPVPIVFGTEFAHS